MFTNVTNPRAFVSRKHEYRQTVVGKGASVGANATIVCGHDLGEYCFVAAGAVVTRDVAPFALVGGVPARRMGWMCRCGVRLPGEQGRVVCESCGATFTIEPNNCRPADE